MEEYFKKKVDGAVKVSIDVNNPGSINPLLCGVCNEYFTNPCLLDCYHSFCSHCLVGPHLEGKISCPICSQTTYLQQGLQYPQKDQLLQRIVELANLNNPQCANCDKRDKGGMFFCATCGQALCTFCRDHTHRAKMFSSHEIVHLSKCSKEFQKRCLSHGQQYIMFCQKNKNMMCATCFRESPTDARLQCTDIDIAWHQASKKMEKAYKTLNELQIKVHDGLLQLKYQIDNLRHEFETKKVTIHDLSQNLQETVSKTRTVVLSDLHKEFDSQEQMLRTQLISLGGSLPILQTHLCLCTAFASVASKYQFLELIHAMLERLNQVGQLAQLPKQHSLSYGLKSDYKKEFVRIFQTFIENQTKSSQNCDDNETHVEYQEDIKENHQNKNSTKPSLIEVSEYRKFNKHCRSFDNKLQAFSLQLKIIKQQYGELHRDVALLQESNSSPLGIRYENVSQDSHLLEEQLESQLVELGKLEAIFVALWEEELCRIHLEKEVFHSQINDISSLKNEIKQMHVFAQKLEPIIRKFTTDTSAKENVVYDSFSHQRWSNFAEKSDNLQIQLQEHFHSRARNYPAQYFNKQNSTINETTYGEKDIEDFSDRTSCETPGVQAVVDSTGNIVVYGSRTEQMRAFSSQISEKNKMSKEKKKTLAQDETDECSHQCSRKSPENVKSSHNQKTSNTSILSVDSASHSLLDHYWLLVEQREKDSQYQRISDASTFCDGKKQVHAQIHLEPPIYGETARTVNNSNIRAKDFEDLFYRRDRVNNDETTCHTYEKRRTSYDSLSTTGSGSPTVSSNLTDKQRSWETFPREKKKRKSVRSLTNEKTVNLLNQLKKTDSFEGHEEAVRTLVAAVQESRSQQQLHTNKINERVKQFNKKLNA